VDGDVCGEENFDLILNLGDREFRGGDILLGISYGAFQLFRAAEIP
jgi:hypothetical protein